MLNRARKYPYQYFISILTVVVASFVCYLISDFVGYRTIALVLLFIVSILAIFFDMIPVLIAAVLSALAWDFFFIPPHYTFHVDNTEDALMLLMYLIIALVNGVLTTRIRKIEIQSKAKEEKLNSIKLYNTLFNSISHEFRTPISTIYGSADNLLNNMENLTDENRSKLISEIHMASERLNRLVGNLLNISRLEAGYLDIKKDWCNLNEIVHSVINSLNDELKTHTVKTNIDDQMPLVKLDYGLIEQVLANILLNSSLYTEKGTEILISSFIENGILVIKISDNGPGIGNDDLERIFDKFYSVKGSKSNGTGLGLSIAKGFVEAHNGKISASHNNPSGMTFIIHIPLHSSEIMNLNSIRNEQ